MPDPHYTDHVIEQLRDDFRRLSTQYQEALDRLALAVEGLRVAADENDRLRAELAKRTGIDADERVQ